MKIFSDAGIIILTQLKSVLSDLYNGNNDEHDHQTSNHMVQAAVKVLDLLITNNDTAFWKKGSNQSYFHQLLAIVDNGQNTYIPAVFNEQSYRLAKTLQDTLDKIHVPTFLEKSVVTFIHAFIGDPLRFLEVITRQLQFKLNIYEQLHQQKKHANKYTEILNAFNAAMGGYNWKCEVTRYTYLSFKSKYEASIKKLIEDSKSMPYFRVEEASNMSSMDADGKVAYYANPYDLTWLELRSNRRMLINVAFSFEQYINGKLNEAKLPPITIVYDTYRARYSLDKVRQFEDTYIQIVKDFDDEFRQYKEGKHLNFFERRSDLFKKKIEIMQQVSEFMQSTLAETNKYFCHDIVRFQVFKCLINAINKNSQLSLNKNKSPGEASKLLAKYSERIYLLFLVEANEENDYEVVFLLKRYEEDIWGMKHGSSSLSTASSSSSSSVSFSHQSLYALTTREVLHQLKTAKESEAHIKIHNSGTAVNLRGLSTPSPHVAWASGDKGTVVRTNDNGKTWKSQQIVGAEELFFRDVKAFSDTTAYVMSAGVGDKSRIYKTQDGGHTWQLQLQSQHPEEYFDCMAFWNADHGIVLSDPVENKFKIYMTNDGGGTWSPLSQEGIPLALQEEGAFAASGSCMAVQGNLDVWFGSGVNTARVFHSRDGGITWEVTNTPLMQDSDNAGIFSMAFYDLNNGVIVGGDHKQQEKGGANIAITRDGGATWSLVDIAPQCYWSAVSFTPDHKNMMMVGPVRTECMSSESPHDKRQSWHATNLNALSFWSQNKALAVGPNGAILEFDTQLSGSTPV